MTMRVIVAPRALRDMQRIFNWIQERSPHGAVTWYTAYADAVSSLKENPERYPVAEESPVKGRQVHQLIFRTAYGNRYRLLFSIAADEVRIMHVRGPGQRPLGPSR